MIVNFPTITREFDESTQTVKSTKGTITVEVVSSIKAHLKWEEQFSKTMQCDLSEYTERVQRWIQDKTTVKANFLGIMKMFYCYINSDHLPTFSDFLEMFDFEIAEEIVKKISVILTEISKSASKN